MVSPPDRFSEEPRHAGRNTPAKASRGASRPGNNFGPPPGTLSPKPFQSRLRYSATTQRSAVGEVLATTSGPQLNPYVLLTRRYGSMKGRRATIDAVAAIAPRNQKFRSRRSW